MVDAYALSLAALVLTAGSLADRIGRRRVFTAGLAIFSIASGMAALAPDATFLNLSRALQGVGGAAMFAVSLALVAQEFPAGRERGTAMGIYGATIGVAVAVGPLVGGALTDALGWESVFYLNVPIGLAAIAVSYLKLRESRDPGATRVDWPGVATFSGALFMLVLALLRGNDEGWGSTWIVSLLVGAAVLLVAFVLIERASRSRCFPSACSGGRPSRACRSRPSRSRVRCSRCSSTSRSTSRTTSTLAARGRRALPAGHSRELLRGAACGALLSRVPARALLSVGLLGAGAGLLLMSGIDRGDDWTTLLGGFLVAGAGVGLLNPVIADVAVSVVPKEQSGMASGINDTFRQVGVVVGIAAWGAIFLARGAAEVEALAAGTPAATGERPLPADRGRLVRQPRRGPGGHAAGRPGERGERGARGIPHRDERHPVAGRVLALAGAVLAPPARARAGDRAGVVRARAWRSPPRPEGVRKRVRGRLLAVSAIRLPRTPGPAAGV